MVGSTVAIEGGVVAFGAAGEADTCCRRSVNFPMCSFIFSCRAMLTTAEIRVCHFGSRGVMASEAMAGIAVARG